MKHSHTARSSIHKLHMKYYASKLTVRLRLRTLIDTIQQHNNGPGAIELQAMQAKTYNTKHRYNNYTLVLVKGKYVQVNLAKARSTRNWPKLNYKNVGPPHARGQSSPINGSYKRKSNPNKLVE